MSDKPRVRLTLEFIGPDRRLAVRPYLASMLKTLLRAFKWRCLEIEEQRTEQPPTCDGAGGAGDA